MPIKQFQTNDLKTIISSLHSLNCFQFHFDIRILQIKHKNKNKNKNEKIKTRKLVSKKENQKKLFLIKFSNKQRNVIIITTSMTLHMRVNRQTDRQTYTVIRKVHSCYGNTMATLKISAYYTRSIFTREQLCRRKKIGYIGKRGEENGYSVA